MQHGRRECAREALTACFGAHEGQDCLTNDRGRYTDASGKTVELCGPKSGGGYVCSLEDLVACLDGGGGTTCFAPRQGHCNAI